MGDFQRQSVNIFARQVLVGDAERKKIGTSSRYSDALVNPEENPVFRRAGRERMRESAAAGNIRTRPGIL